MPYITVDIAGTDEGAIIAGLRSAADAMERNPEFPLKKEKLDMGSELENGRSYEWVAVLVYGDIDSLE